MNYLKYFLLIIFLSVLIVLIGYAVRPEPTPTPCTPYCNRDTVITEYEENCCNSPDGYLCTKCNEELEYTCKVTYNYWESAQQNYSGCCDEVLGQ